MKEDVGMSKPKKHANKVGKLFVGLYGSVFFNFGSYVSFPTLFACFLGFDIPTSSFTFIENVFYYSFIYRAAMDSSLLYNYIT